MDLPDDEVWHLATAAQCEMILKDWERAAGFYQHAARHVHCRERDRKSIRQGCRRTKEAFGRFDVTDFGPLNDETAVFDSN